MSKWEYLKRFLVGVLAAGVLFLCGNRQDILSWMESFLYIGILAAGFYGGILYGAAAGLIAGILKWRVFMGESWICTILILAGVLCASFRSLGKGASCVAFAAGLSGGCILTGAVIADDMTEALLIACVIFLIVSTDRSRSRFYVSQKETAATETKALSGGKKTAAAEANAFSSGKKTAATEANAFSGGKEETPFLIHKMEACYFENKKWKRFGQQMKEVSKYFGGEHFLVNAFEEELTAQEWKQRFLECRQVLGIQFLQIGQAIEEHRQYISRLKDVTSLYETRLKRCLKKEKLFVEKLQIVENGNGRQEIFMRVQSQRKKYISMDEAASYVKTAPRKVFYPAYDCCMNIGSRSCEVHLVEKPKFYVEYGISRRSKKKEEGSGDCFSAKLFGEASMLLCLSDGMGTGKRAQAESKMAIELLERFLENEFSLSSAAALVNQILLTGRKNQVPTTLDICLVDLYSGNCRFAKMGAAAGYLKRGNRILAIRGQTVPLGILSWENRQQEFTPSEILQNGDLLVMMTDGASEKAGIAADVILKDLLALCPLQKAEEIAQWLLEQLLILDEEIRDDMTILAARIRKNS